MPSSLAIFANYYYLFSVVLAAPAYADFVERIMAPGVESTGNSRLALALIQRPSCVPR